MDPHFIVEEGALWSERQDAMEIQWTEIRDNVETRADQRRHPPRQGRHSASDTFTSTIGDWRLAPIDSGPVEQNFVLPESLAWRRAQFAMEASWADVRRELKDQMGESGVPAQHPLSSSETLYSTLRSAQIRLAALDTKKTKDVRGSNGERLLGSSPTSQVPAPQIASFSKSQGYESGNQDLARPPALRPPIQPGQTMIQSKGPKDSRWPKDINKSNLMTEERKWQHVFIVGKQTLTKNRPRYSAQVPKPSTKVTRENMKTPLRATDRRLNLKTPQSQMTPVVPKTPKAPAHVEMASMASTSVESTEMVSEDEDEDEEKDISPEFDAMGRRIVSKENGRSSLKEKGRSRRS